MLLPSLRPDPLVAAASVHARPLPAARVSAASNSGAPPSFMDEDDHHGPHSSQSSALVPCRGASGWAYSVFGQQDVQPPPPLLDSDAPASSRVPIAVRRRVVTDAAARPAGVPGCTERRLNSDRSRGMRRRK